MRHNKWITIACLLFITYAVYNAYRSPSTPEEASIKESIDQSLTLTKETLSTLKEDLTPVADPLPKEPTTIPLHSQPMVSVKPANPNVGVVGRKIVDLIDIYASTPSGQRLMNKLLENAGVQDPTSKKAVLSVDTMVGSGEVAQCGLMATLHVRTELDKTELMNTRQAGSPLSVRLGARSIMPGIELGALGMKVGGQRKISIPSEWGVQYPGFSTGTDSATSSLTAEIELLGLSPSLTQLEQLQVFDTAKGHGDAAHCGDLAVLNYRLYSVENKLLYDGITKGTPISMTVGAPEFPIGITIGLIDMRNGGNRKILLPASLLRTAAGAKSSEFFRTYTPPETGMVIMELFLMRTERIPSYTPPVATP